jgi:class 3 adenylate cyclase
LEYTPRPIDTSRVALSSEIQSLTERLAEHAHDVWAVQRLNDGWVYGPKRDDKRKKHPCLVAYDQLSEAEKQYDRNAALETLRAMVSLGYRIEPPRGGPPLDAIPPARSLPASKEISPQVAAVEGVLEVEDRVFAQLSDHNVGELWSHEQTLTRRLEDSVLNRATYRALAHQLLKKGEPLLAHEVIESGHRALDGDEPFKKDGRLRQLMALALARSGATKRANEILDRLDEEERSLATSEAVAPIATTGRVETLSILARTHKDLAQAADPDAREMHRQWDRALQLYLLAYSLDMSYYPGINAAAISTFLRRTEMAEHLAGQVRETCMRQHDLHHAGKGKDDPYWLSATLGEAWLIERELEQAELWYGDAARIGLQEGRFGDMGSTLRQLKLLVRFLGMGEQVVSQLFRMPCVAVFAGHMVDQPLRSPERLPERIVPQVKRAIADWLEREDVRIGFGAAACGADLLFLEAILERQGAAHVILPFDRESYCETSVEVAGKTWKDRYRRVLAKAKVQSLSGRPLKCGEVAYDYTNRILHGLAIIHARQLATELRQLVVWNGESGDGPGGTGDVINHWSKAGKRIDVISVPDVRPARPLEDLGWAIPAPFPTTINRHSEASSLRESGAQISALLFADVVGFSKMDEDQIPVFVDNFLQLVAELLNRGGYSTEKRNTWGDGLYVVFDEIRDAGVFAIELSEHIKARDWKSLGLPESLSLRTALHAGPVYLCRDPVTERPNCIGTHVSLAARIEPVTPPGEVYASEAFAALALSQRVKDFVCDPVGHIYLPKNHGMLPMYHVRRRR